MKAAFLTGSKTFELRDIDIPKADKQGIVVEVKACGVCGSDLRRWKEGPSGDPVVSGHEASGVVVEVGSGVRSYNVGDRIAIAPDIHCAGDIHIEVKRRERFSIPAALRQSRNDAKQGQVPVVAHRPNRCSWMVTVELADLPRLARAVMAITQTTKARAQ